MNEYRTKGNDVSVMTDQSNVRIRLRVQPRQSNVKGFVLTSAESIIYFECGNRQRSATYGYSNRLIESVFMISTVRVAVIVVGVGW